MAANYQTDALIKVGVLLAALALIGGAVWYEYQYPCVRRHEETYQTFDPETGMWSEHRQYVCDERTERR